MQLRTGRRRVSETEADRELENGAFFGLYLGPLWQLNSLCSVFSQASCISLGCQCWDRTGSWWREQPQTASAWAAQLPKLFDCVCYSGSWKEKTPAGWHQYYFSTFHYVAIDPMSLGPASVQHNRNLQFLSQKNPRYRTLFMIQALFCPELNQFLYKQLGSRGSFASFSFHSADR